MFSPLVFWRAPALQMENPIFCQNLLQNMFPWIYYKAHVFIVHCSFFISIQILCSIQSIISFQYMNRNLKQKKWQMTLVIFK